jgi:transposase
VKDRQENNKAKRDDGARPDPEVPAVAQRRRFSAKFKNEVLDEVDRRKAAGQEIGSYLRKKGLATAHISHWRKAREEGSLRALEPRKRGRKPEPGADIIRENQRLRAENDKLRRQLEQSELVIDVQKKLSQLLGLVEQR